MSTSTVIGINYSGLEFTGNIKLYSDHKQQCCEHHYLDFSNLTVDDFTGLEFDLSDDKFFNRVEGYGIELIPVNGHPIRVPGYGSNNGYYSDHIDLIVEGAGIRKKYDVSECQEIVGY